ncbi:MAG TPA: multicopper oxidase family protein, partial [Actinoplanes sp.]|nr:multicopper oxidase family protein [Actinoplanes sp.]
MPAAVTRRRLLSGIAGTVGLAGIAGTSAWAGGLFSSDATLVTPASALVAQAETARRRAGARTVTATLTPRPVTLDLGGTTVQTWAYAENAPGPL